MFSTPISEDELDAMAMDYEGHVSYANSESDNDLGGEISQRIREAEVDDTHPRTDTDMDVQELYDAGLFA